MSTLISLFYCVQTGKIIWYEPENPEHRQGRNLYLAEVEKSEGVVVQVNTRRYEFRQYGTPHNETQAQMRLMVEDLLQKEREDA
jgi:hypothetical protein